MDIFKELIDKRVEHICAKIHEENEEYKKSINEYNKLFHKIKNLLPEESQYLLFQLDNSLNYIHSIECNMLYKQGLKDKINFSNIS